MEDRAQIEGLIDDRVEAMMQKNNESLLKDLGNMLSKISANQSSSFSALDLPKFKRKSNEEQLKQNSKVLTKIEEAEVALNTDQIQQAKESILQAKDLLKRSQKLIRLADSSELGWRVVNEYESNPLASDSEDEIIYKAEARASTKARTDKKKSKTQRLFPCKRPTDTPAKTTSRPGACFLCGKVGHWKKDCYSQQTGTNNKLSKNLVVCENDLVQGKEVKSQSDVKSLNRGIQVKQVCPKPEILENKSHDFQTSKIGSISQVDSTSKIGCISQVDSTSKIGCISQVGSTLKVGCISQVDNEKPPKEISPVGRLKNCLDKWRDISDSAFIIGTIETGYKLPLKAIPPGVCLKNNKSARDNLDFVLKEVESLMRKAVVTQVYQAPKVVNPLTVAFSRVGKPRLVLDCRHINEFLHSFKIKFEDINTAEIMFDPSTFAFVV